MSTNPTDRTRQLRLVQAAGGYFSKRLDCWVLPGKGHNCCPRVIPTRTFRILRDASDFAEVHAQQVAEVLSFGEQEAARLRRGE
jgi:hypothetical protein